MSQLGWGSREPPNYQRAPGFTFRERKREDRSETISDLLGAGQLLVNRPALDLHALLAQADLKTEGQINRTENPQARNVWTCWHRTTARANATASPHKVRQNRKI